MSKGPQKIRGTQDIWGEEADRFHAVVEAFERVRRLYAFQRVEMPVFEATEVFARSIGETTDIVSKEMYTFEDRGGDRLTLRPEFTAGICRAYHQRRLAAARAAQARHPRRRLPLRAAAKGPLPPVPPARRRDHRRRRARRRRRDHRHGRAAAATSSACSDRVELKLNTLGDPATRDAWRAALVEHFGSAPRRPLRARAARGSSSNPLRILDSKEHQDCPIVDSAPVIDDFLTAEAADFFAKVTAGLDAAGVAWTRDPAAGARPRLLSPHRLRVRHRRSRRAERGDRRRPL